MRIFKSNFFARYARRAGLDDASLCRAVRAAEQGLVDADLGGGVIKQRVARPGEGKSGGFRTIIVFKVNDLAFFVYGFAKNKRGNIRTDELTAFKKLAATLLAYSGQELDQAIEAGAFTEVMCDEEEQDGPEQDPGGDP